MEKKSNKTIRGLLIGNIVTISLAVVMLVSLSFAWFMVTDTSETEQSVQIGKFIVNLNDKVDKTDYAATESVAIVNGYPMSRDFAMSQILDTNKANRKNLYRFSITNTGTISAAIYLKAVEIVDTNASVTAPIKPLTEQVRFAARLSTAATYIDINQAPPTIDAAAIDSFLPADTTKGFIAANPAVTDSVGIDDYFKGLMLTTDGTGTDAKHTGKVLLAAGQVIFVDIAVWIDETATIESTGVNDTTTIAERKLTFKLKLFAMQSDGGAYWTDTDLGITTTAP